MTNPNGRFRVDPEGLVNVGDAYAEHVVVYDEHGRQLQLCGDNYDGSWGDDEMGAAFRGPFRAGLQRMQDVVAGIRGAVEYTAVGLRSSGVRYRTTDDEACEKSHKLIVEIDDYPLRGVTVSTPAPTPNGEGQSLPFETETPQAMARAVRWQAPSAVVQPEPAGLPSNDSDTPLSDGGGGFQRTNSEPADPPALVVDALPHDGDRPPLIDPSEISPFQDYSENDTPHVDGVPIADGYRLRWFSEFPGGAVRLDLNLYESVSPVGDLSVSTSDGQMVAAGNSQPFVVKERAGVDPMEPGYQPMYVDFTADGTRISLVTDLR